MRKLSKQKHNILFTELVSFMTEIYGSLGYVDKNTKIEQDLRITGDEAWDFLIKYGKYFNVETSNFIFSDYFEAEGIDFITPILEILRLKKKKKKKELTIGHLIKGIEAGKLDDEIINASKKNTEI